MRCEFRDFVQRRCHGIHPRFLFLDTYRKGHVALTQSRMAALIAVGGRTAKSLDQKQGHPLPRGGQIHARIERTQDWIEGHSFVKSVHQGAQRGFAAYLVKYYCFIFVHTWNYTFGPAGV